MCLRLVAGRCRGIRREMCIRALFEDHVSALPRLVIDEPPLVTRAGVIHCQQDITGTDGECLAAYGCKFEDTGQGENVLRDRIIVPVEG